MSEHDKKTDILDEYKRQVWRDGKTYVVRVVELSLETSSPDLTVAYEKMDESVQAALREFGDAGLDGPEIEATEVGPKPRMRANEAAEAPATAYVANTRSWWSPLKVIVVLLVVGVVGMVGVGTVVNKVSEKLTTGWTARVSGGLNRVAERLRTATPEEKQRLREDLHTIAKELRPFVDEIAIPFNKQPDTEK